MREAEVDMIIVAKEDGRWFAYIPVKVGGEASKWHRKGYIRGERDRIKQKSQKAARQRS